MHDFVFLIKDNIHELNHVAVDLSTEYMYIILSSFFFMMGMNGDIKEISTYYEFKNNYFKFFYFYQIQNLSTKKIPT